MNIKDEEIDFRIITVSRKELKFIPLFVHSEISLGITFVHKYPKSFACSRIGEFEATNSLVGIDFVNKRDRYWLLFPDRIDF